MHLQVTRDLLEQGTAMVGAAPHRPQHSSPFYKLGRIITKEDRPLPESPPVCHAELSFSASSLALSLLSPGLGHR